MRVASIEVRVYSTTIYEFIRKFTTEMKGQAQTGSNEKADFTKNREAGGKPLKSRGKAQKDGD